MGACNSIVLYVCVCVCVGLCVGLCVCVCVCVCVGECDVVYVLVCALSLPFSLFLSLSLTLPHSLSLFCLSVRLRNFHFGLKRQCMANVNNTNVYIDNSKNRSYNIEASYLLEIFS